MTDPFAITGPAIINVSGGRTSALMLRRILDAHGGALPADVHAVFANTSRELPETLDFVRDCDDRWGVRIHWIERTGHNKFREVDHTTAARAGEPFDALIREKQFLPNAVMRFCTQELKIRTVRAFMRSLGYEHWTSVLGLRFDEPRRVANVRAHAPDEWDVACPLYDARVTRDDVHAFWRAQPFDLSLRPWESNCDGCYLKSSATLERVERDRPGTLDWWIAWETRNDARFDKSRTFAHLRARARLPVLPGILDSSPDDSIPCHCTD